MQHNFMKIFASFEFLQYSVVTDVITVLRQVSTFEYFQKFIHFSLCAYSENMAGPEQILIAT